MEPRLYGDIYSTPTHSAALWLADKRKQLLQQLRSS